MNCEYVIAIQIELRGREGKAEETVLRAASVKIITAYLTLPKNSVIITFKTMSEYGMTMRKSISSISWRELMYRQRKGHWINGGALWYVADNIDKLR